MRERSVGSGCAQRPPPPPPSSCLLTPETLVIVQGVLCSLSLVLILSWLIQRCKVKQRQSEIKGEDSVNQTVVHPKENPEKTYRYTLCTCVQRYSEIAETLVLQSEVRGQLEYCPCRLRRLQHEDPDAAGSLSNQNKSGRLQGSSKEECFLPHTDHHHGSADCKITDDEGTVERDLPHGSSHLVHSSSSSSSSGIKSLAQSGLSSECASRQACTSNGKIPIIPGSGTLGVADSRDVPVPSDVSVRDNVLRRLVCTVWRYILQVLHTMIGMLLWRMLVAFTHSPSVPLCMNSVGTPGASERIITTVSGDKSPRLIVENYGSLEVKKPSIEMNLRQKHLEYLLGAFTAFKQSLERLSSEPCSPPWLRRSQEESELELTGAETPFLSQETRDKLEFNVKNKLVQRLWGLPVVVQRSQSTFIPEAPELCVRTMLPEPACRVQVTSGQAPVLTEEQQYTLMNCVSHKQDVKTEGYPEIVMESRSLEMPESMAERLRQGDVTGQAKDAAEATPATKKKRRWRDGKRGSVSHQTKPKKHSQSGQD